MEMTRTDMLIMHGHMDTRAPFSTGHAGACAAVRGVGGAGARGPGRAREARAVGRHPVCFALVGPGDGPSPYPIHRERDGRCTYSRTLYRPTDQSRSRIFLQK
jgi:hypothetical protein